MTPKRDWWVESTGYETELAWQTRARDARHRLPEVLAYFGADYDSDHTHSGWLSIKCPFHDDTHASASVSKTFFRCHACGTYGDAIGLVTKNMHKSYHEAIDWIEKL